MDANKCPTCGWKHTGHGWEDHACWCPIGWRALDRKLEELGIDPNRSKDHSEQTLARMGVGNP